MDSATVRVITAGPAYVDKVFCKYLECVIFARGFARARCDDFDQEFFVAFIHRFGRSPNTHVHLERTGKRWLLSQINDRDTHITMGAAYLEGALDDFGGAIPWLLLPTGFQAVSTKT